MDGESRLARMTLGVRRGFGGRIVIGAVVVAMTLAVGLPAVPDWQVTLFGFRGRLSMTLLAITTSGWATYHTDGLLPGVAPAVCLGAGLFLGGAWVVLSLTVLWMVTVGGFGAFLGASLRRYREGSGSSEA